MWVKTADPAVRVNDEQPHPLCDVFGHKWEMNPVPTLLVFANEQYSHSVYTAMCRRCPVAAQIDHRAESGRFSQDEQATVMRANEEGPKHQVREGDGLWIKGEFYPDWFKGEDPV